MLKKFFIMVVFFCTVFSVVGNSWAECNLEKSMDRTPSNEDLYPKDPDGKEEDSRMALICQRGKCGNGEVVYATAGHYRKRTLVNEDKYYKCTLAADDRWVDAYIRDIKEVSTDRGDYIGFDSKSQLLVYGTKVAGGKFYTNVHYVEPDEKCGVKCTPDNSGNYIYCDESLWICSDVGKFSEADNSPFGFCTYTAPQTRTDSYTVENEWAAYAKWSLWGAAALRQGDDVDATMSFCMGCKSGFFSGGDNKCYNKLDEAWCNWRKNKESKNTEWKTDHCECTDKGKEWDTEKHDCVKKKGSGSGKTGGGTTSDTKCGVKCNKENENKILYCDGDVFKCSVGVWNELKVYDTQSVCASYRNPITPGVDLNRCKLKRPNTDDYLVCVSSLVSNSQFVDHPFCWICSPGRYLDFRNWLCIDQEQKAWCYVWDENETKWNEADQSCECLEPGKKWDTVSHTCIADNGAGDDSGQGGKKITTKNCKININATVKCRDSGTFSGEVELELSAENCQEYQANSDKNLSEIAKLLCVNLGGVDNILSDADVQDAKKRVDKFFEYAESNRNVWKNEEGKFNTARLASDATAGVILGTVGGIVSANIIKKKQVEKGFDALKCTIGGRKVADWGDEFRVGFGAH